MVIMCIYMSTLDIGNIFAYSLFLPSFHPEMALFRNLCVNLRDCLCDVLQYASAQPLDFLDLAKNCSFLNRKLRCVHPEFPDGHYLKNPQHNEPLEGRLFMKTVNALKIRNNLGEVLDLLNKTGEPILVSKGRKLRAVLITPEQFQKRFLDYQAEEQKKHLLETIDSLRADSLGRKSSVDVLRELRGYTA